MSAELRIQALQDELEAARQTINQLAAEKAALIETLASERKAAQEAQHEMVRHIGYQSIRLARAISDRDAMFHSAKDCHYPPMIVGPTHPKPTTATPS